MSGPGFDESGYLNCLRISDEEAADILAVLGRGCHDTTGKSRRKQERLPYEQRAGLIVKMHHPGGSIENYLVRVRNLSNGGICFLHGSFAYPGTRCSMVLRARDNRASCIDGTIVRCKHVRKHIHEIGLQFEKPIRLGDFVASALRVGIEVESSRELPQLSGTVMYVEDSVSDQELMAFHLANVGIKVRAVSDVLAAVELASEIKFDAVLASVWLPAMSGLELADFLRQSGYKGPIIALTADDRPEVREDAHKHGCTTVLVKPYHFEELYSVLEPHLQHADRKELEETLMSNLWGDSRMQPLIRSFLTRLSREIVEIERQVETGKVGMGVRKLCFDVKGTAGGYGFPRISEAAQKLLELLMDGSDGNAIKQSAAELVGLSRAACSLLKKEAIAPAAPSAAQDAPPRKPDIKAA